MDAVVRIVWEGERRWRWFVLAGFAAAFTAANELPALSLTVPALGVIVVASAATDADGALPAALGGRGGLHGNESHRHTAPGRRPTAHRTGRGQLVRLHATCATARCATVTGAIQPASIAASRRSAATHCTRLDRASRNLFADADLAADDRWVWTGCAASRYGRSGR